MFHCIVRVVKKYPFSKHLLFLDVIAVTNEEIKVHSYSHFLSIQSLVVKSEDASSGIQLVDDFEIHDIRAGDILEVAGHVQSVDEEKISNLLNNGIWNRPSIVVKRSEGGLIKQIEKWDTKVFGLFTYEENNFLFDKTVSINTISSTSLKTPTVVLQARNKTTDKALELLRSLNLSMDFRESSLTLSKSKDRLILGFDRSSVDFEKIEIATLSKNGLLSQAICRIYPINYKSHPCIVHPHLSTALSQMYHIISMLDLTSSVVRIQSYPRHIATTVVSSLPAVHWSPRDYTHVMSVILVDAVWMISLIPSNDFLIEDIYEHNSKFGNQNNSVESTVVRDPAKNDRVCKSINKLHEILTRNNWIYSSPESCSLYPCGLCIDIGASPGGWSTYMARNLSVQRIISVDKGIMNIDDSLKPPIEHWQQLGQDAIEKLRELNQQIVGSHLIDLYCCDANIAPILSTSLLIKTAEYGLFSHNARFVLTLKNTLGNQKDWNNAKQVCLQQLQDVFSEVHQVNLLANTPKETTVTGIYIVK